MRHMIDACSVRRRLPSPTKNLPRIDAAPLQLAPSFVHQHVHPLCPPHPLIRPAMARHRPNLPPVLSISVSTILSVATSCGRSSDGASRVLVPGAAIKESSVGLWSLATPLLEEERGAAVDASVSNGTDARRVDRPA